MFKTFDDKKTESMDNYVKDSQNRGDFTNFSTVIAMYEPWHGAHCIYERWKTPRERIRQTRLLKEVEASINTADMLKQNGIKIIHKPINYINQINFIKFSIL